MTFTICDIIVFRSEDGAMWSIAQPENRLSLTTIPVRLLTYLLENPGRVISRQELFDNIWQKYGYEPSNNSVNQYISLIRRSLQELGCEDELIKTVPRMGYYLNSDKIAIERGVPSLEGQSTLASHTIAGQKINVKMLIIPGGIIVVLLMICLIIAKVINHEHYTFSRSGLYKFGYIDQCPLYGLTPIPSVTSKTKEQAAHRLAGKNLPCVNGAIFIFQSGEFYDENKTGRAFITRCLGHNAALSSFADCRSNYFYAP